MTTVELPPISRVSRGKSPNQDDDHGGDVYARLGITDPLIAAGLRQVDREALLPGAESDGDAYLSLSDSNVSGGVLSSSSATAVPATSFSRSHAHQSGKAADYESYCRKLDQYLAPLLKSMVSERPEQPHSFIVDYVNHAIQQGDASRPMSPPRQRPLAPYSLHEYKSRVLDPTIRPLMAELFLLRPQRPLRAIFQHAHHKLNTTEAHYAVDLVQIDLHDEMAAAVESEDFEALDRAIQAARRTLGGVAEDSTGGAAKALLRPTQLLLGRAERLLDKGLRAQARLRARGVAELEATVRRTETLLLQLHERERSATQRLRRLSFLTSDLSRVVAHAHRKSKVSDREPAMKAALLQIVRIDHAYRDEQKAVQLEHRDAALASLERALEAVGGGGEGGGRDASGTAAAATAHTLVTFSLHRARALRCDPRAPVMQRAAALVENWEAMEAELLQRQGVGGGDALEFGGSGGGGHGRFSSLSLGLVGKMKTQLSRKVRTAKERVEEMQQAQRELGWKLEDSDDEFYKEMGYDDDEAGEDGDDDSGSGGDSDGSDGSGATKAARSRTSAGLV